MIRTTLAIIRTFSCVFIQAKWHLKAGDLRTLAIHEQAGEFTGDVGAPLWDGRPPPCPACLRDGVRSDQLNAWNQPFYNALERRDLHGFFVQLVIFCIIAGALLLLNVPMVALPGSY